MVRVAHVSLHSTELMLISIGLLNVMFPCGSCVHVLRLDTCFVVIKRSASLYKRLTWQSARAVHRRLRLRARRPRVIQLDRLCRVTVGRRYQHDIKPISCDGLSADDWFKVDTPVLSHIGLFQILAYCKHQFNMNIGLFQI